MTNAQHWTEVKMHRAKVAHSVAIEASQFSEDAAPFAPVDNVVKVVTELNQELRDFTNRRLQHDFSLPLQFAICMEHGEIWRAYGNFWQQVASDYQNEFFKLIHICNRAALTPAAQQASHHPGAAPAQSTSHSDERAS